MSANQTTLHPIHNFQNQQSNLYQNPKKIITYEPHQQRQPLNFRFRTQDRCIKRKVFKRFHRYQPSPLLETKVQHHNITLIIVHQPSTCQSKIRVLFCTQSVSLFGKYYTFYSVRLLLINWFTVCYLGSLLIFTDY